MTDAFALVALVSQLAPRLPKDALDGAIAAFKAARRNPNNALRAMAASFALSAAKAGIDIVIDNAFKATVILRTPKRK